MYECARRVLASECSLRFVYCGYLPAPVSALCSAPVELRGEYKALLSARRLTQLSVLSCTYVSCASAPRFECVFLNRRDFLLWSLGGSAAHQFAALEWRICVRLGCQAQPVWSRRSVQWKRIGLLCLFHPLICSLVGQERLAVHLKVGFTSYTCYTMQIDGMPVLNEGDFIHSL